MLLKSFSLPRSLRSHLSSRQLLLLLLVCIFLFGWLLLAGRKMSICNPEEALWWFCPWPEPRSTVCSWDEHFPSLKARSRSPEAYDALLQTLPRRRPSFEFNNKTLLQCEEESLDLLIFVISKCSHSSIRQTIRRTWGNLPLLAKSFPHLRVKLLFLLDIDGHSERKIELEHLHHGDLVQVVNLPEDYSYVTERESAIYHFVAHCCPQSHFLFKTDDDIFLNTFLLLTYLSRNRSRLKQEKYFLSGSPIRAGLVVRHTASYVGQRYIITRDEYACPRYPLFLSGFGYLMSRNTSRLFLQAYLTDRQPFPLSDVYFTGLLAEMFALERRTLLANLDYHYEETCQTKFFAEPHATLACAASNDHFQQASQATNFMNDYNLYWSELLRFYRSDATRQ